MAEENSTEQSASDAIALKKPGNPLTWVFHPFGAKALKIINKPFQKTLETPKKG